ncbi:putative pentatricopeptide repeat-containing protein At3g13770, mitochondrial [Zingiber officinale]|uniref:putative pentatricopeptide repeat-containing protein At3g13770, mitochondrial n=1 Tax=Zingiber officinale TaxID=94328 RepID=UPI001C4C9D3A|nr:putative pentatricopeptide repeat-containing protein At3g13770, mitochondrial [Zingiber officinale]
MLEFGSTIFSSSVPPRATWSAEPRLSTRVVDYVACTVADVGHRAAASTWRRPRDWLPDDAAQDVPFSTLFNCCASLGAVRPGRELHGYMIRRTGGNARTCCSESSLVSFYAKCGFTSQARKVFDQMPERDIVAWAVMLKAYADGGHYRSEMMHLFVEMLCEAIAPNSHTLSLMLSNATPDLGEQLHASAVKWALDSDAFVGSSLVDFYSRNGSLGLAQLLFDRIPQTDVVCYNCLISKYGGAGITEGLISLYSEMCSKELMPNQSTFVGLLGGCAHSGLIGLSKQFHAQAIVQGFGFDEVVQVILVDMYAKCGDIESCRIAFDMSTVK